MTDNNILIYIFLILRFNNHNSLGNVQKYKNFLENKR